jgi:hypothetical protein
MSTRFTFEDIHNRLNTRAVSERINKPYPNGRTGYYDVNYLVRACQESVEEDELELMKDYLYETTSSCTLAEAKHWMSFYMNDALQSGMGQHEPLLRAQYLAAYEISKDLSKN